MDFPGEDIRKILRLGAQDGNEYLLASAAVSERILRIDTVNGEFVVVAQGLDVPDTMVIDPLTGKLLVATATEIITIERSALQSGLAPSPAQGQTEKDDVGSRLGSLANLGGITGIGVDNCTGNILLAQSDQNRVLSLSRTGDLAEILPCTDESGPIDVLAAPNEILVTYRANLGCPDSTNVLFIEEGADRVSLYIPAQDLLISPWIPAAAPSDLILVPAAGLSGEASVLIEQGGAGSEVLSVDVSDILEAAAENPPVNQPAASATAPPGPDLAVTVASITAGATVDIEIFYRPGGVAAAMLVLTLDYDEDVLQLANGTLATSATSNLPGDFQVIGFHDPNSTDRELGFLIVDSTPPLDTLVEGNILRLSFAVNPQATGVGDVWILSPGPQLIDLTGIVIGLDEVSNGGVSIRP